MEFQASLWSKAYAPTADTHAFSVQVDQPKWEEIMRSSTSRRVFLGMQHMDSDAPFWVAPMGQPVQNEDRIQEQPKVYMPLWMLDAGHFHGIGEPILVRILDEEAFPPATRIVLRVVDSALYNADIKEELENALSALGVIRKHTTLQIPVEALGGFTVDVFVANTEPADLVFCEGEEVALEFEEPVDQIQPPAPRPPTPIPQPPAELLADPIFQPLPPPPGTFVPFAGEGVRLGGSNDTAMRSPWADALKARQQIRR